MDDREIERILSRYQPVSPSSELRARALAAGEPRERIWPWAAAAAALLAATVGFDSASHQLREPIHLGPDERDIVRRELTDALGGDDLARTRVEIMLAAQDALSQTAASTTTTAPSQDLR